MTKTSGSLLGVLLPFAHVVLSILGLGFLVAAAYVFTVIAGLIATGLALLVLAFYLEQETS